jgi:hypothetical protein
MSAGEPRLEQVQRWMQSVIMHRGGVAEGVESPEAREHIDLSLAELGRVILRSRALSSADRLEIYVNAYYARLMECLEEEFAATRAALGEELFAAVTFGYLQSYPSRSYTLNQLGARFPAYLAESRLHASAAPQAAGPTWADFVVELATFERALYEVYDGPGNEDGQVLDAGALARVSPDEWEHVRLVPSACLRLVAFEHPVDGYWEAFREGGAAGPCGPRSIRLAIYRREYVVERLALSATEFGLLTALVQGATLPAALATTLAAGHSEEHLEMRLGEWFSQWTVRGFFVAVERL